MPDSAQRSLNLSVLKSLRHNCLSFQGAACCPQIGMQKSKKESPLFSRCSINSIGTLRDPCPGRPQSEGTTEKGEVNSVQVDLNVGTCQRPLLSFREDRWLDRACQGALVTNR